MMIYFFFSTRRRHARWPRDWSSDVCSSDLDERGRWASNTKPEPTSEPSAPAAATQQQLDPAQAAPQPAQPGSEEGPVPSWRHRELREQRDAVELRNRQLEAHLMDQARQLRALQDFVQKQQQPAPQVPDMIVDP